MRWWWVDWWCRSRARGLWYWRSRYKCWKRSGSNEGSVTKSLHFWNSDFLNNASLHFECQCIWKHLTSWNDHWRWSGGHDVRSWWRHGDHIDAGSRNHGRHWCYNLSWSKAHHRSHRRSWKHRYGRQQSSAHWRCQLCTKKTFITYLFKEIKKEKKKKILVNWSNN